jgi:hypothetical protein
MPISGGAHIFSLTAIYLAAFEAFDEIGDKSSILRSSLPRSRARRPSNRVAFDNIPLSATLFRRFRVRHFPRLARGYCRET